jgi:hypothetical protein
VAEAWGQIRNPQEGKCLTLETATRGLVMTQLRRLNACCSELQSVCNIISARDNCSYKLEKVNKSNYQSEHHL